METNNNNNKCKEIALGSEEAPCRSNSSDELKDEEPTPDNDDGSFYIGPTKVYRLSLTGNLNSSSLLVANNHNNRDSAATAQTKQVANLESGKEKLPPVCKTTTSSNTSANSNKSNNSNNNKQNHNSNSNNSTNNTNNTSTNNKLNTNNANTSKCWNGRSCLLCHKPSPDWIGSQTDSTILQTINNELNQLSILDMIAIVLSLTFIICTLY